MRHRHHPLAATLLVVIGVTPAVASDFSAYGGVELYQRFCASCHGRMLAGDGPVAQTLAVAVPDLTRIAARHGGTFPDNWVYRVIDGREAVLAHGPRDMPVWGVELWREHGADVVAGQKARDLIERLVTYLKEQQAVRQLGDPGH
ncbi:MAG TPA: c-type cytochrome [Steroidobacteraceae bacterium]|nr:c-type cytochrome [Steroidobacteraceae bacterium]